jgi:hypothetical protein
MNYKIDSLYNKVYSQFIKGFYGIPKIPNKNEVLSKIEEITSTEYIPITSNSSMKDIDIKTIRKNFSNIIDDIDILFSSIEKESTEILDQLTNSLKEHNGVKREMRRIKTSADDIANGKLGDDYLKYNFTESFESSTNINSQKSDPINYDAGIFTIRKDTSNVLSLDHYRGSKIEFNIIENFSQVSEYGYVGSTDASIILDQTDPRQLIYKINTNTPTRLKTVFTLQLGPNKEDYIINSVTIDVDSDIAKGYIRLYYKDKFEWKDVDCQSIQEIKSDKVIFNFSDIKCSYIKIEFIKESPDSFDLNTYYYVINNISITQSTTKRTATLYSKPIIIKKYESEIPIVNKISVSGDVEIPKNCDIKIYVAEDIKISGGFLNSGNFLVNYSSPEIYQFDNTYSGYVYLSELINSDDTITGVLDYKGQDFNWKEIQFLNNKYEQLPRIVDFNNTNQNDKLVNSLFLYNSSLKFGDHDYSGIYSLSGWVNNDNPDWATLESGVYDSIYVSGINVAEKLGISWEDIEDDDGNLHPSILLDPDYSGQWIGYAEQQGYPFGYNNSEILFNDYKSTINGWWRPYVDAIAPTGILSEYSSGTFLHNNFNNFLPDLYFNNTSFYKIYKFGKGNTVLDSTIKLYTYQERPINSINDVYPCNFKWRYRSKYTNKIGIKESVYDSTNTTGWINYTIPVSVNNLNINEEYIFDSISEVRIHNTSTILDPREYQIIYNGDIIIGIDLSSLSTTREMLKPSGVTFDFKYLYKTKNEYLSTWTSFIITSPGEGSSYINIPNIKLQDKNINLIQNINITNLDTGQIVEYKEDNGGIFNIPFFLNNQEGHYKITIYCASNDNNGFCADNWIPFEGIKNSTISSSSFIKIVSKLDPIKVVSLDSLLYSSFLGEQKCAIYNDLGEKYIIVKCPSKDSIPGYYFDSVNKKYYTDSTKQIDNKSHWIRQSLYNNSGCYYTTGSCESGVYNKNFITKDLSWNDGSLYTNYPNFPNITYPHHSTYGYPINISIDTEQEFYLYTDDIDPRAPVGQNLVGSIGWTNWLISTGKISEFNTYSDSNQIQITDSNRGFLFHNTAENLPNYYSISYQKSNNIDDTINRFLYKIVLTSDDPSSIVPKVKSIRFIINEE